MYINLAGYVPTQTKGKIPLGNNITERDRASYVNKKCTDRCKALTYGWSGHYIQD